MPVSVNWLISARIAYSSSNAIRQEAAPAPPEMISVPSMSKRMARYFDSTDGLLSVSGSCVRRDSSHRLLAMATEALAHGGEHLVGEVVEVSGVEPGGQRGGEHRRGHALFDRCDRRPAAFARVGHATGEVGEIGGLDESLRGEVQQ